MPATPLHTVGAWAFLRLSGARGSLVAAFLASMTVDLEVPFYALYGLGGSDFDPYRARGILHSLLGVFTLNALVVWALWRHLMPAFWRWATRRWPEERWYWFSGADLRKEAPNGPVFYLSTVVGGLSHLVLDLPSHSYNPVLWPYTADPLAIVPFSEDPMWDVAYMLLVFALFLWMLRRHWGGWARGGVAA